MVLMTGKGSEGGGIGKMEKGKKNGGCEGRQIARKEGERRGRKCHPSVYIRGAFAGSL